MQRLENFIYMSTYKHKYFKPYCVYITGKMNNYRTILDDLSNILPVRVTTYSSLYEDYFTFEEKFMQTRKALTRAKNTNNRILQLANVFYLGQLLETGTEEDRNHYASQLTGHYKILTKRTYYIFEIPGVSQIMRTTKTKLSTIRLLSSKEYEDLVLEASNIFQRS